MSDTKRMSAHQLARKLLEFPDYLVIFDGTGKHIAMVNDVNKFQSPIERYYNPGIGEIVPKSGGSPLPVVVIELEDETNPI
jgi:hypothetical protein